MTAITFPNSPTSGDSHTAGNGVTYVYDGEKWTTVGSYSAGAWTRSGGSVYTTTSTDSVGIGTSSPSRKMVVSAGGAEGIELSPGESANNNLTLHYNRSSSVYTTHEVRAAQHIFSIDSSEKLRIDSSGRLLVGTDSSADSNAIIQAYKSSGPIIIRLASDSLSNGQVSDIRIYGGNRAAIIGTYKHSGITNPCAYYRLDSEDGAINYLWTDNSNVLRISSNPDHIGTTSGTVVGTQTSDERLKNIGDAVSYGLAEVKQLQPKQYALKSDPDVNKLGFIAQEVESIIPEAVFDTKEELENHQEGDRTKLGMEYVQLIPVLVNAIKELSAENDALKERLDAAGL